MCLSRYFDEVSTQLASLMGYEPLDQRVLGVIDHLEKRIQGCGAKLRHIRVALEELERRILEKEGRLDCLIHRVEIYHHLGDLANAWQSAMTLDQLRELVSQERLQFRKLQRTLHRQNERRKQFQIKLANLLATFYLN